MGLRTALGDRLGIDADYLVQNGLWITIRYGVTALLGLATTVIFTRLASPETYGTYQFAIAIAAFFSFLSLPGLNMAALKAVVIGNDRAVFRAIGWSFLGGLISIPCILGYAWYHDFLSAQALSRDILVLVALAFPFFYALNTWYVFYEGRKNFLGVTWRTLLISLVTFLGLSIALSADASVASLLAIYFGTTILFSLIYVAEIYRTLHSRREEDPKSLDVRYGLGVTGQKFVYGLSETLPVLVIGILYGYQEVAFFQIAFFFFSSISGYVGALVAMYFPRFFEGAYLEGRRVLTLNALSGLAVIFGMGLFLLLIFPVLYGEDYSASRTLAWYLVPIAFLLPLKTYLLGYFTTQAKSGFLITVYIVANLLGLGVAFLLRETGVVVAAAGYLSVLTLSITIPLLSVYLRDTQRAE